MESLLSSNKTKYSNTLNEWNTTDTGISLFIKWYTKPSKGRRNKNESKTTSPRKQTASCLKEKNTTKSNWISHNGTENYPHNKLKKPGTISPSNWNIEIL